MLTFLVELLPERLQDRAKALIAGGLSAVLALVATGLLTGEWDKAAIAAAVLGLIVGPTTYAVPNAPRVAPELDTSESDSPEFSTTGRPVSEVGSRSELGTGETTRSDRPPAAG